MKQVTLLNEGDEHGVGAVRRMRWSTALPYELVFDIETTKVEPPLFIEGRALGELDGIGRWTLQGEASACRVRYDWIVTVTKPWMVRLSFILRPVFRWNHGVVMERGRRGLSKRLA
ncbi:SRPBCC family protein [Ensifer adhaerens]